MPSVDANMGTLKITLMLVCFLFQIGDAFTTEIILSHGLSELNPIMALAQTWLGGWWLLPKLALACVMLWLLSLSKKPRHIAYVMILCAMPVYNNLIIIAGLHE